MKAESRSLDVVWPSPCQLCGPENVTTLEGLVLLICRMGTLRALKVEIIMWITCTDLCGDVPDSQRSFPFVSLSWGCEYWGPFWPHPSCGGQSFPLECCHLCLPLFPFRLYAENSQCAGGPPHLFPSGLSLLQ